MAETNVANTVTILGRTDVIGAWTHWKTIVSNNPASHAVLKINSLFIVNRNLVNTVDLDMQIARDPLFVPGALYSGYNQYFRIMQQLTLPKSTTMIAISRDNPIWLQPGDFLQIRTSLNYSVEAVCSYEYISDTTSSSPMLLTTAGPVHYLNAAPTFGNGGVELTWTPPFSNGGVAITNYLIEMRRVVGAATLPWYLVQKPVSDTPNFSSGGAIQYQTPTGPGFSEYTLNANEGIQFRVAAYNPKGLGAWSEPTPIVRMNAVGTVGDIYKDGATTVGVIEAIDISPIQNGAILNWSGQEPRQSPKVGETLTILGYNIRWSSDNGMTWYPSPNGLRRNNDTVAFEGGEARFQLSGALQNGEYYVFSLQTICRRTFGGVVSEIVGPWTPPTRAVSPPGDGTDPLSQGAVKAMFVTWTYPE